MTKQSKQACEFSQTRPVGLRMHSSGEVSGIELHLIPPTAEAAGNFLETNLGHADPADGPAGGSADNLSSASEGLPSIRVVGIKRRKGVWRSSKTTLGNRSRIMFASMCPEIRPQNALL